MRWMLVLFVLLLVLPLAAPAATSQTPERLEYEGDLPPTGNVYSQLREIVG